MADNFKDKVRSIAFPRKVGKKEKVDVVNEDTGKVGGYHVKHWDGRQDAHVMPDGVSSKAAAQIGGDEEGT